MKDRIKRAKAYLVDHAPQIATASAVITGVVLMVKGQTQLNDRLEKMTGGLAQIDFDLHQIESELRYQSDDKFFIGEEIRDRLWNLENKIDSSRS
jgi:hypothetical protein